MQNRNQTDQLPDREIEQLTNDLEQLQLQINTVNARLRIIRRNRENTNTTDTDTEAVRADEIGPIAVGDTVQVTNKYKGRRGVVGEVIKLTPTQAVVRPRNGGEDFRMYKANLKKL